MIEKTKLSLWDFFVSMLSGYAIILSILIHALLNGLITWEKIFKLPAALLAVAGILMMILAGLLFEPLANLITKFLTTCPCKYAEVFGFKAWDDNIRSMEKKARQYIPKGIEGNTYQYCKNWLNQKVSDDLYAPFLAKYGFYRSMFFLNLLNAISIPFIYEIGCIRESLISTSLLILALVYLRRGGVFYRHMSSTVYSQYILFSTQVKKGEGD